MTDGFGYRLALVDELYRSYIEHLREYSKKSAVFGDVEWLAAKIRKRRGSEMEWIDDSGTLLD